MPLGAVTVTFAAGVNSSLQLAAAPAMRGRVMALYSVVFLGSTPIGAPLVGWLAEAAGPARGAGARRRRRAARRSRGARGVRALQRRACAGHRARPRATAGAMSELEALAVLVAGMAAGAINTVVGSGTLVTFPVLLSVGYSPVVANVSNNIGLVPGAFSGAIGYRRELEGQRERVMRLGIASLIGGALGAVLLLVLPARGSSASCRCSSRSRS